jgi:hypothetical protein
MSKAWSIYEKAAAKAIQALQHELGLSCVEGKQTLIGKAGTPWEIDAKAWQEGTDNFLVVEARRYTTSRLKQEEVAAIAFRIQDLGAVGGIVVSPLPMQKGAQLIANSAHIEHILLSASSSPELYLAEYMGKRYHGMGFLDMATISVTVLGGTLSDEENSKN